MASFSRKWLGRFHAFVSGLPGLGPILHWAVLWVRHGTFPGTVAYWESHYAAGGDSGPGSCGEFAAHKAAVVNSFVRDNAVASVTELGCGDGAQLSLAEYPRYVGLDVSRTAIELCRERYRSDPTKRFFHYAPYSFEATPAFRADLALSLQVVYHIVEDELFDLYLTHLFSIADRFVVIFGYDRDDAPDIAAHIRYRSFPDWVAKHRPDWHLMRVLEADDPRGSRDPFYFYSAP